MLWVRSDLEVEQIPVPSAELTAAKIRLPDRMVLMVSVYVEGGSDEALEGAGGAQPTDQEVPRWNRDQDRHHFGG